MEAYLPVTQEFKAILRLCNWLLKYTLLKTRVKILYENFKYKILTAIMNSISAKD